MSESSTKVQHQWVEMTITPVEVVGLDGEGLPVIFHLEAPSPQLGCGECLTPMQPDNLIGECPGREEDE